MKALFSMVVTVLLLRHAGQCSAAGSFVAIRHVRTAQFNCRAEQKSPSAGNKVVRRRTSRRRQLTLFSSNDDSGARNNKLSRQHQWDESSAPANTLRDVRQLVSVTTFSMGIGVGVLVVLSIIMLRLYSVLRIITTEGDRSTQPAVARDLPPESGNRSTKAGGSRTALLALYGRSQAYRMRLPGSADRLAPELMKRISLFGTTAAARGDNDGVVFYLEKVITSVCSELSLFNYRLTGRLNGLIERASNDGASRLVDKNIGSGFIFEDQVAFLATLGNTGLVAPIHARTRWLDEKVDWFIDSHTDEAALKSKSPIVNVILLGSGYDTRPYRMGSLQSDSIQVYEVDASGTQTEKEHILHDLRQNSLIGSKHPTFVSCDFSSQNWLECLFEEDFDKTLPTLVIWEGVTMYLPLSPIRSTLKIVANGGSASDAPIETPRDPRLPHWFIAFDYLNPKWAYSPLWKFAMRNAQEPFQSAFTASDMDDLLMSVGLNKLEALAEGTEIERKYATDINGKQVGVIGDYGGYVLAGPTTGGVNN